MRGSQCTTGVAGLVSASFVIGNDYVVSPSRNEITVNRQDDIGFSVPIAFYVFSTPKVSFNSKEVYFDIAFSFFIYTPVSGER